MTKSIFFFLVGPYFLPRKVSPIITLSFWVPILCNGKVYKISASLMIAEADNRWHVAKIYKVFKFNHFLRILFRVVTELVGTGEQYRPVPTSEVIPCHNYQDFRKLTVPSSQGKFKSYQSFLKGHVVLLFPKTYVKCQYCNLCPIS